MLRHLRADTLERSFALFILATGLPGVLIGATIILNMPDQVARIALNELFEILRKILITIRLI